MTDRPLPGDLSTRPMSALSAIMWTLVMLLLEHLSIAVTAAGRPAALTDIVNLTGCEVLATSLVVFVVLRAYAPDASLRRAIGFRTPALYAACLAVLIGAALGPVLSTLDDRVLSRFPYDDPEALAAMKTLVSSSPRWALVVGVFVVIPITRELFFRGLLFGRLAPSQTAGQTLWLTTILFACAPLDWRALPSGLVFGLVLGVLRAASGSVVTPLLAQMAFWSIDAIPILAGRDPAADTTYSAMWVIAGAGAATLGLLVLFLAAPRPWTGFRARLP